MINPAFEGRAIIVNGNDYLRLAAQTPPERIGVIHLFDFDNWRKTASVVDKLTAALEEYNLHHTQLYYDSRTTESKVFRPDSRIGIYAQSRQSGQFMLFLFSFVGLLFFISSAIIIHFKLLTEYEKEKVKYKKLYKIGITRKDLSKLISKELLVLFLLPNIIATIIAIVYSYSFPSRSIEKVNSLFFSLEVGVVYLCVQFLFYTIYRKYYLKKFDSIFV